MTEKVSYVETVGHGIVEIFPSIVALIIISLPVVFFYQYAGVFLINHYEWSQESSIGGVLARFYESNFLEIIKNINWKIRESGFFAKIGYIILTYLVMIIYMVIPPFFTALFTKNRLILGISTILFWAIPLLLMGGLIYMVEYFSK